MAAVKTKRISTLIESQLPEFITDEYELFSKFVQKYYEAQEVQGGALDIISNIQKYADIDFYEKNLLKQNDILSATISATDTTITVNDARSFPEKNGYIRINDEIIFYATRTDTQFLECSRGVSGNTTLGDLYNTSNFSSTEASSHQSGETVFNVSNLFLYALVRNFESQYLSSFPEKYLKGEIDKRTLIKNIQKFYKAKGTQSSIKFIFNTIVAKDIENKPEVYNPKDFTYKASKSDWTNVFAIKAKVVTGDPKNLIGKQIVQQPTDEYGYASATIDNVYAEGTSDGEQIWNLVVAPETVNGIFEISTKTKLENELPSTYGAGKRVDVFSTIGWDTTGSFLIGDEVIEFDDKNVTQFIIKERGDIPTTHAAGSSVYKPVTIEGSGVTLLTFGVVYGLAPVARNPYSSVGDQIQVSNPGFETTDPKIIKTGLNQTRWLLSQGASVNSPTVPYVATALDQVSTNVSAIFADEQYYYITSSSFPSYKILDGSITTDTVADQKILRIIRQKATNTTEIYKTPKRDVGILLNGVPIYGYKDPESVRYGKLEKIDVNTQGNGYAKPPFVLIDDLPNKARAFLAGQVVDSIEVTTEETFISTPKITITSGRNAKVRAVVTGGKVTSLVIDDPGEFYSSPPIVNIRDNLGRGRFANYQAVVNSAGEITGFDKIEEGNFYNQNSVVVDIIPVGSNATGTPSLKEWNFNRFQKLSNNLDTDYGHLFENYNPANDYGYGHVGNPKTLRISLSDNIDNAGSEPTVKTHSPIIGFAYDGNPIYGPFGYENPLNPQSSIVRMTSSYSLNGTRSGGPSTREYALGTFVNDYTYAHKSGSLDENNGRFCVTPDFPEGTYAYFLTINSNQIPQFPYFLGDNYYSLPVDSNYNSSINQNDVPKNAKRFYLPGMSRNGEGLIATVSEVKSGTVDGILLDRSSSNFSVNSKLYFDEKGTDGSGAEASVSSVKGKSVSYLESKEDKVVKLTTIQNAYLFADDTLRQPASGASGDIVGTVQNDNVIVLRNVIGTFNNTGTFSADIKTFTLFLDKNSTYTEGATLSLTDGINPPIATAEVLDGSNNQNIIRIKVLTGTWIIDDDYFLQSSDLFNTSGTKIVNLTSLSDNLEPFDVNQNVALIETAENHGLGIGDNVIVDINPDDNTKTKTYYLRKRLYQEVVFRTPVFDTTIDFTGIGKFTILNGGADYAPGQYQDVPLTGGSGSGATASITVSDAGLVSSIQIQSLGEDYRRGDYLSVDDESLSRSLASLSTARFTVYVDHVGFAAGSSKVIVKDAKGYAEGDLIQIGEEVVEISSINGTELTVIRARENTKDVDHFDGQRVSLYNGRYNFTDNYQVQSGIGTGYIKTYDPSTQTATIVFDYGTLKSTANPVALSTTFFDSSNPNRLVTVVSVSDVDYKFEFSEDNQTFDPNPNIDLQEYYRYLFDTSHSSLTGTFFDVSPSGRFNLITLEKLSSSVLPGNPGAFTDLKFGFGSRLEGNTYQEKVGTNFTNFYYFDKNGIVNAEGKYFKIVQDPLQGAKTVNYVTPNRFVYDLTTVPLWDGSGSITYTTSGQFAVGEINSINVSNLGLNYKKVPIVLGCDLSSNFIAKATVLFDTSTQTITGVNIDNKGSNYVNPKVVIIDGDGSDATFNVVARNGEIFSITVDNPGRGYTYAPVIQIIESDVEAYVDSNTIGNPQSINIFRNGGAYHLDKTVSSTFTTKYVISLKDFNGNFLKGETVSQSINGVKVFTAKVAEWRFGSNLLKLENTVGSIRNTVPFVGKISNASGMLRAVYVTSLAEEITSFYDNIGSYQSDRGKIGVANQKLTDSFFYQDYSYVVKSKTPIDQWRDLIKSTTHPAGFKLFGQVDIETDAETRMPAQSPKSDNFSIIQLWDPEKNKITVESTRRIVTQTITSTKSSKEIKGVGSAHASEFNFSETRAFEVTLAAPFDGVNGVDATAGYTGGAENVGTKIFQLLDDEGNPFTPVSAKNLIITLNGILQEPEVSYTVSGDKIIFSQAPLGPSSKLTGTNLSDLTSYDGTKFYGRYIEFKDNQYNTQYFKKLRNIFQRNGRWLDAANQIQRNREFIVEESVGYGREKYPNLDWSTKIDDYLEDVGHIIDAYEHDVRFGGNVKTVDYLSIFSSDDDYDYITTNKTESLDIFKYATNLSKLSVRNWDVVEENVSYIQGSRQVTVADTNNLAIGMFISSGTAFASGTKIVSIDSNTQITLNNAALANSGGAGGAAAGVTDLNGSTGGSDFIMPTSTGAVQPGNQYAVDPGDVLQAPISFSASDSATFYFSGINNGTFWDASDLIAGNKEYFKEEIAGWFAAQYPNITWTDLEKDIDIYTDATVYHLRFGGNEKVVDHAQLYYERNLYPYPEQLKAGVSPAEFAAAYNQLKVLMVDAMRNALGAGTYTSIPPFTDSNVATDTSFPYCAQVESALNNFYSIIYTILNEGKGLIEKTSINANYAGNWSRTLTYSNYNIIPDPLLSSQECNDVISSIDSLFDNVNDILNNTSVTRSTPDFLDGETTTFDMYWDDDTAVNTEEDEDLFLTLNAVLQRPKYTPSYPLSDAYYIDRTTIPNKLVFDVAPIWDQDFSAKSIGEPTAVELVAGIGVGNYKRLTIDFALVDEVRGGPFLILDVEDNTSQEIEQQDYLFVFLDGVLQRREYSYTIAGSTISFNVPIKKDTKIDMRYLYGRDLDQIINFHDFVQDAFYAQGLVTFDVASGATELLNWIGLNTAETFHAWQVNPNGSFNVIGKLTNPLQSSNLVSFTLEGQKCDLIQGVDVVVATKGNYSNNRIISLNSSGSSISYVTDEEGRLELGYPQSENAWRGTFIRKFYKDPFVSLSDGDYVKIEGESDFRRVKKAPEKTTSKEHRNQGYVTGSNFGIAQVEAYNGVTRGEGLSIVAKIENGSVVSLEWNQRSYDPLTQPTAYQYYTPPVLHFIPKNGNGGGAKAVVLVSKGQVISVDLLDGGSGYTEAPRVVVARRYDILQGRGFGVSAIGGGINSILPAFTMSSTSLVDVVGNQVPGVSTFTTVLFDSPFEINRKIEAEIQLIKNVGDGLICGVDAVTVTSGGVGTIVTVEATTAPNEYLSIISGRIDDIISTSVLVSSRQLTSIVTNEIDNTDISAGHYHAVGAFLSIDLDPTDNIVFVPDISRFSSNGYLQIGTEVVRYYRKSFGRFLNVQRGQEGTTAQFHPAGTFVVQIPDPVSVAYGGISRIESESQIVTLKGGADVGRTEKVAIIQSVSPGVTIQNIHRDVITEVQAQLSIQSISNVNTVINYEVETKLFNVKSFNTTHKETTVEGEIQLQIENSSELKIEQTIVSVAVNPTITSTALILFTSEVVSKVSAEPVETAFDSLDHNETTVRGEIKKDPFTISQISIEQTIVRVAVNPVVTSTALILFTSEVVSKVSTEPVETSFDSLGHKETTVRGEIKKLLIANTYEINQTIINVAVHPIAISISEIGTITDVKSLIIVEPTITVSQISQNQTFITNAVQSVQANSVLRKETLEVLLFTPPSGVIDGYEESVIFSDPILTRAGFIDLIEPYTVTQRDGNIVAITNASGTSTEYVGQYTTGNAGPTLRNFDQILDDGVCDVSGLSLLNIQFYYPNLTINDFVERANSSYTLSGDYFNLATASIQNPVAISNTQGLIPSIITILGSTTYFPSEGYLYTSTGAVIKYTGTTQTTFTGCTLYSGTNQLNIGDELIPFSIS